MTGRFASRGAVCTTATRDRAILALAIAEGAYYRSLTEGLDSFEEELRLKGVERAQRRHLSAVKTLAQVRKLGLVVVQVNIAEKQINLAR
jgi:hypothetical protein